MRIFVSRLRRLRSTHLIFLLCGLWVHDASAQDAGFDAFNPLRIGVKAGANLNQFSQPGMVIDVNGGAMVHYQITNLISVQGELLYMGIGGGVENRTVDLSGSEGTVASTTYLNRAFYMKNAELPIMVKLSLPTQGGTVAPKLLLGGSYSYSVATFENFDRFFQFSDGSVGQFSNATEMISSSIQPHQFAVHGGIGMEFDLGGGKVFYQEIRYRQGINNINIYRGIPGSGGKLFPSTISLNFGLFFL